MSPEEVPTELVALARKRIVGAADIALREMLAAVLPEHEKQARERIAKEQAAWLPEILHVVWGFAMREHKGTPQLVPAHAEEALRRVPGAILDAARVARGES
jgi:hypothetical protein